VSKPQGYREYVLSAKRKSLQRYLFNDAASNADHSAPNDEMIQYNELKGMCKEADVVHFETESLLLPGRTEDKQGKASLFLQCDSNRELFQYKSDMLLLDSPVR